MGEDKLVIFTTPHTKEIYDTLDRTSNADKKDKDLKTDLFSLYYLQNPEFKNLEELDAEVWLNYFIVKSFLDHYSFNNVKSFTKDNSTDSYWVADKIINEIIKLKENKKISKIFDVSIKYLNDSKDQDYDDLINDRNISEIKKQIKAITGKVITIINSFYKKIEPLLELTRGHGIVPISLYQIDDNKILQLNDKLLDPKYKELIKMFVRSNIKDSQSKSLTSKTDETQSDFPSHSVFYVNDPTQDNKEIYKNWLTKEMREYSRTKNYKTQLTAYIKAGNLLSKTDEIDTLSFALNILEIARMGKRNFNVIISKEVLGDKTYIFKNNDEVEIFENNQSYKFPILDGIVSFVLELLSAPTPPKPKFSLGLNFSNKKRKVFKKPPRDFIKFT